MANVWIVTTDNQIEHLLELGNMFGGSMTAVVPAGTKISGVSRVIGVEVPAGVPVEALAPVFTQAVAVETGDLVLVKNGPVERVLAGAISAKYMLPVVTRVKSVAEGRAVVLRYGGISEETFAVENGVVAVVDGGVDAEGETAKAESVAGESYEASITSVTPAETESVDLSGARRVVGAGLGFETREDLAIARNLADALDASFGVTRPVAERSDWVSPDLYIGISGQQISPEIYIAAGISGQLHHTAGIADSKVIVVVNNDDSAPIFKFADYGIVGDLHEVLPAITELLN